MVQYLTGMPMVMKFEKAVHVFVLVAFVSLYRFCCLFTIILINRGASDIILTTNQLTCDVIVASGARSP